MQESRCSARRPAVWVGLLCACVLAGAPPRMASGQAPPYVPSAAVPQIHPLPSLREQAAEQQRWLEKRLTEVLPRVMREHGVEMWVLSMREYAEDPVFWSIVSPTTFAARRRSIYVLFDRGPEEGVERIALGGTSQGGLYTAYRSSRPSARGESGELWGDEQWRLLRELVEDRDPKSVVVNIDETHAFADGLHAGEREALERALGPKYVKRVRREPRLAMDYIAQRIPQMLPRYRKIQETVHAIISQAFSNAVITPGVTSTEDVVWWLREKLRELGMTTWFQPSLDVQRAGEVPEDGPAVIQRGDVLWTDFGVIAMGLRTDTQHNGYVLREGEREVPEGIRRCLKNSNRLQELLLEEMVPGRTGNEILGATLARMRGEGIDGTVYAHPIGDHGHGAGPLIGRWDNQEGIPGRGDLVLRPSTWHSIELQARTPVAEWGGKAVRCRQEEEAYLDEQGKRHWVYRRQEKFHLVW
ncbi:MAG: M24 family metallopeptidase [Gemmatimonadetes bacterium]|nr:M24 family metallopeptidase [Gemmatimonadota bacterium]